MLQIITSWRYVCGLMCCATLVLNKLATKGKLHLRKKTFSLHQLGNIELKGHRDIKIQFFKPLRNGEKVRGWWGQFRCFFGRSKVNSSQVLLFSSPEVCEQSTYSCFSSHLLPCFSEHCMPPTPSELLHVTNILT